MKQSILHIQHGMKLPTMHSTMHLYPINGAASKVAKENTAWNYRDATWAEVIVGVDPDPANKDIITNGQKITGMHCIPIQPEVPISTS